MDLDAQVASLQQTAPKDGSMANALTAIAPTLKAIASQLKHEQYYVLQTLDQRWMMIALDNRARSASQTTASQGAANQKVIVYAYPTLQDATQSQSANKDPQLMAIPVPVIHIIFQLLAMEPIDSIIFFETPGQATQGIELRRQDVQALIQAQLRQTKVDATPPSDIA